MCYYYSVEPINDQRYDVAPEMKILSKIYFAKNTPENA
jgi:hypothetical protein